MADPLEIMPYSRPGNRSCSKMEIESFTESSSSSVPSFFEFTGKVEKRSRISSYATKLIRGSQPTSHPFFWRSHPKVTVTSYEEQRPRTTIWGVVPLIRPATSADLTPSNIPLTTSDFPANNRLIFDDCKRLQHVG